jgi:hypothetical protein
MATKTFIGFNKKTTDAILKGMSKPIKDNRRFFSLLRILIDQATQLTFRLQGARGGHPGWKGFSPATLRMPSGTFNIRYGTDLTGRPKGTYTPGKIRPGVRRYSESSKLLQASGGFKRSFKSIFIKNGELLYGISGLKMRNLGKKIMSDPERQVLFVTPGDRKQWGILFKNFIDQGIKF